MTTLRTFSWQLPPKCARCALKSPECTNWHSELRCQSTPQHQSSDQTLQDVFGVAWQGQKLETKNEAGISCSTIEVAIGHELEIKRDRTLTRELKLRVADT